ncbi:Arginine/ornithine antiporter [compost metagenome]
MTNIIIQLFVISTYWSTDAFSLMLNLTSAMSLIPYLLVAAFGFMLAHRGETYEGDSARTRDLVLAGIAAFYSAFMIYAGGLKYVLLAALLYAPGTILYYWARREQGQRLFTQVELVVFVIAAVGCGAAIDGLVRGWIVI